MLTIHEEVIQGSDQWLAMRRGILTASEMKLIVTPTLKVANNDKEKTHLYELLGQRITGYVEPFYISDDMMRGMVDEITARELYAEKYASVTEVGFITNDKWGWVMGYSPDALVGDDGAIECKSRRAKYQVETLLANKLPDEYLLQVQTGLLVSEREWIDFVSYSAGLPMFTLRVYPDPVVQQAILNAAHLFYDRLDVLFADYQARLLDPASRLIPTERKIEQEIVI